MTATMQHLGSTAGGRSATPYGPDRIGRTTRIAVLCIALAAVVARIPSLAVFPSSDEGGFLMLASQWHPASSLYGNYWVDRPPFLILVFQVAQSLGGITALRVVGMLHVAASVLLAATLPHSLSPHASARARARAAILTASVTGALLLTPLFGGMETDGELLAVPWILAGFVLLLRAQHRPESARQIMLLVLAGVAGSAAWLTKQNFIDVYVLGAALAASLWLQRRHSTGRTVLGLAFLTLGLLLGTSAALYVADRHGTSPSNLWNAVVAFRFEADHVIAWSSSGATPQRFVAMLAAFVASAAPVVIVGAVLALRDTIRRSARPDEPVLAAWPWLVVLAWELVAVVSGGSYWLHYLIGLVPGTALLVAAAALDTGERPPRRDHLRRAVAACVISAIVTTPLAVPFLASTRGDDRAVAGYLRDHKRPGDTAVVAYGHPDILEEAHLASAYPDLWSLPVRVHDPRLTRLGAVLTSRRPRWLITAAGSGLSSWGLDATTTQGLVDRQYRTVYTSGKWSVLERRPVT